MSSARHLRASPPFRADHVGSLLRPPELNDTRAQAKAGRIPAEALAAIEVQYVIGLPE